MLGDEQDLHESEPIVHQSRPFNLTVVAVFVGMVYYLFGMGLTSFFSRFGFIGYVGSDLIQSGIAILFGVLLFGAFLRGHKLRACHTLSVFVAFGELLYSEFVVSPVMDYAWLFSVLVIFGSLFFGLFLLLSVKDEDKPILALVNCDILLHFAFAAYLAQVMF